MRALPVCFTVVFTLAACAEPYPLAPDLLASGAAAPYPALVPVERITAQVPPATTHAETDTPRADRLRARAARLRGPVIDPDTEARMRRGVDG